MRNLKCDVDCMGHWQASCRFDPLPDGYSFDVLKGDVVMRPVLTDAVHSGDVFVIELRGRPPLLIETRDDLGIVRLDREAKA